ncbi:hypothetical protein [Microbulbifer epialgicus]|uniref:Uncharacterized protein n=1 Tax=Microbulbifer epialgicus TaxID=393907 RepID=A0ABV4NUM4_9GAMM
MYYIKALKREEFEAPEKDSLNWNPDTTEFQLLRKNNFTCDCCGLISRPHQEVKSGYMEVCYIEDKNHILCNICAQSQYVGRKVNGRPNHGFIFYCPDLTQGQISSLALWSFVAKYRENQFSQSANRLVSLILSDLVEPVSYIIPGFTSGDVQEFADIYKHLPPKLMETGDQLFSNLKYWPNEIVFEPQIRFWNAASFHNINEDLEAMCQKVTVASNVLE